MYIFTINDPEDWNNILFDIYEKSENVDKQIAQAKKILFLRNESIWHAFNENELLEDDIASNIRDFFINLYYNKK